MTALAKAVLAVAAYTFACAALGWLVGLAERRQRAREERTAKEPEPWTPAAIVRARSGTYVVLRHASGLLVSARLDTTTYSFERWPETASAALRERCEGDAIAALAEARA